VKFETGITHKMFELNSYTSNSSKKQIQYPVYAIMQNGVRVIFFDTPWSNEYRTREEAEELNKLIKDKNSIYIDYWHSGH